jgi:hypothetical protein
VKDNQARPFSTFHAFENLKFFFFCVLQDSRSEQKAKQMKEHQLERRKIRRSAGDITKQLKTRPKFWMGKRVQ